MLMIIKIWKGNTNREEFYHDLLSNQQSLHPYLLDGMILIWWIKHLFLRKYNNSKPLSNHCWINYYHHKHHVIDLNMHPTAMSGDKYICWRQNLIVLLQAALLDPLSTSRCVFELWNFSSDECPSSSNAVVWFLHEKHLGLWRWFCLTDTTSWLNDYKRLLWSYSRAMGGHNPADSKR